jgi:RNA polymerase sigma-70 factor (ECF subfamily)
MKAVKPAAPATDEQLLRRVARGDETSFDELYRRHAGPIFNYLLRLTGETVAAEDVLQEVFVAAWQGARGFRGRAQVKTWLFQIAHNQAVSWWRHHRPISLEELENVADEDAEGPDDQAERVWQADQVKSALERLPAKHREVIELAFVHGLSYKEIAQVVNRPVGTVKSRMSNARRYLDGWLKVLD